MRFLNVHTKVIFLAMLERILRHSEHRQASTQMGSGGAKWVWKLENYNYKDMTNAEHKIGTLGLALGGNERAPFTQHMHMA